MRSAENFTNTGKLKKINWTAENTPAHWLKNEPILTYLGNTYIIVTTEVERFTIKIGLPLKDKIKDEQLKLEWAQLIDEEIAHAYQHTCVTNDLKRHKYPIKFMTKYSKALFWVISKMGIKSKLAFILAMEFYAHELASSALENNLFPVDELAIYDFLRWHAEEEMTHSSLCFRVYKYFGGGYIRRVIILLFFTFFASFTTWFFIPQFFFVDIFQRRKVKFKNLGTAYRFMYGRKGAFWGRFKTYLSFFNPRFNPGSTRLIPNKERKNDV